MIVSTTAKVGIVVASAVVGAATSLYAFKKLSAIRGGVFKELHTQIAQLDELKAKEGWTLEQLSDLMAASTANWYALTARTSHKERLEYVANTGATLAKYNAL